MPSSLSDHPIHTSVESVDREGMAHISLAPSHPKTATQAHTSFAKYLQQTKNTICGRHPIGVLLGSVADLQNSGMQEWKKEHVELKWTKYEQSSRCEKLADSSVSYASAYLKAGTAMQ